MDSENMDMLGKKCSGKVILKKLKGKSSKKRVCLTASALKKMSKGGKKGGKRSHKRSSKRSAKRSAKRSGKKGKRSSRKM